MFVTGVVLFSKMLRIRPGTKYNIIMKKIRLNGIWWQRTYTNLKRQFFK